MTKFDSRLASIVVASVIVASALDASPALARTLSLSDAVNAALRIDPALAEAKIAKDRSKLTVLRSQLDRVTFTVDGQLQELWNASNIGGKGGTIDGGQGLFNLAAN